MPNDNDNVTIKQILDKEALKDLADKIVNEDVDKIIVVYRDKTDRAICWATTISEWATIFGEMYMAHDLMDEEWRNQNGDGE